MHWLALHRKFRGLPRLLLCWFSIICTVPFRGDHLLQQNVDSAVSSCISQSCFVAIEFEMQSYNLFELLPCHIRENFLGIISILNGGVNSTYFSKLYIFSNVATNIIIERVRDAPRRISGSMLLTPTAKRFITSARSSVLLAIN